MSFVFEMREKLKKAVFEKGDEASLDLYVKWNIAWKRLNYQQYARIFGFCRLLGINSFYDIGCGDMWQAFLFAYCSDDIFYTGIDRAESLDFTYINELFAEFCGERIKFQKGEYPFGITPRSNNIAIACNMFEEYNESKNTILEAFSRDFERIFINISSNDYREGKLDENVCDWQSSLTDFTLYKIGYGNFIFGTKFPKEISILKNVEYNYLDERFSVESIDFDQFYDAFPDRWENLN